jgi:hypothetical protein
MPKNYVLKNSPISKSNVDRLLKVTIENAKKDREKAEELFRKSKETLDLLDNPLPEVDGIITTGTFTSLMKVTTETLSQLGHCNEKLLKIATFMHKELSSDKKSDEKETSSFFAMLEKSND